MMNKGVTIICSVIFASVIISIDSKITKPLSNAKNETNAWNQTSHLSPSLKGQKNGTAIIELPSDLRPSANKTKMPSLQNVTHGACDVVMLPLTKKFKDNFNSEHFCSNLTTTVESICYSAIVGLCVFAPHPAVIFVCQSILPLMVC